MKNKLPWNHNFAYNKWIKNTLGDRKNILDVGCGNGILSIFLRNDNNLIVGIDPSDSSIKTANVQNEYDNVNFIQITFEGFEVKQKFDAVIFVASIHHMNMEDAINKAKTLLNNNGILVIVGLAKPSSVLDWFVECARIIPSGIISFLKKNRTSEDLCIDVSYDFPTMNEVRRICNDKLQGYKMKYGLHYRYLLTWKKH